MDWKPLRQSKHYTYYVLGLPFLGFHVHELHIFCIHQSEHFLCLLNLPKWTLLVFAALTEVNTSCVCWTYRSEHFLCLLNLPKWTLLVFAELTEVNTSCLLTEVNTSCVCCIVAILDHLNFLNSLMRVGLCKVADGWVRKNVGNLSLFDRAGELEPYDSCKHNINTM